MVEVKQRVLFNFGRLDILKDDPAFKNIVKNYLILSLKQLLRMQKAVTIESEEDISDAVVKNWGYIVYRKLWQELEIDKFLKGNSSKREKDKI